MKCAPLLLFAAAIVTAYSIAAPAAYANLAPKEALQELKNGNVRFATGKPGSCLNAPKARGALTKSQAPDAIVLSCSDSRVPPEQVFDQGLGKLFTIRVAGNILNEDALASIEYA